MTQYIDIYILARPERTDFGKLSMVYCRSNFRVDELINQR